MKNLNFAIDSAILGTQQDISLTHECLEKVNSYTGHTIAKMYAETFMNEDIIAVVNKMIDYLKAEFVMVLEGSDWLEAQTREEATVKVKSIRGFVGYSEHLMDDFKEVRKFKLKCEPSLWTVSGRHIWWSFSEHVRNAAFDDGKAALKYEQTGCHWVSYA